MKALRHLACLLVLSAAAMAQTGSWTLYYSDSAVVNGDGSVTITPTVSLSGNDGGWCSMTNNTYGYETPVIMLNGNAWQVGWTYDSDGTYVHHEYTFPSVTLPANGQSVDLSYAGKVQGICFSMNDPDIPPPYSLYSFYSSTFVDGTSPQVSPAPCWLLTGLMPACYLPFPSPWTNVPRNRAHVNLYSEKAGQKKWKTTTYYGPPPIEVQRPWGYDCVYTCLRVQPVHLRARAPQLQSVFSSPARNTLRPPLRLSMENAY